MAKGNAQFIKNIIDDTKKSTQATYSSDKIEKLLGASNADMVYLTTVSATAPAITSTTDKYYNTSTKLVYSVDNNAWDAGEAPKSATLYIDEAHNKMYVEQNGELVIVSGSGGDISKEANNALENKPDGFYVEDLNSKINLINQTTKLNKDGVQEYLYLGGRGATISVSANSTVDALYLLRNGDLTTTIDDNTRYNFSLNGTTNTNGSYVTLLAGVTYKLKLSILASCTGSVFIYDEAGTNLGNRGFSGITRYTDVPVEAIVKYNKDTKIYFKFEPQSAGVFYPDCSFVSIEAMSYLAIDPMNYIDNTQGIEDIPVGNIITKIGNKMPPHYLPCDGSEYNIVDYPYLAQAIKDEFGTFDYYGGDGINTFKVPNLKGNPVSLIEPATSYTMPNYTISASSEKQLSHTKSWMTFNKSAKDAWNNSVQLPQWIQIEFNVPKTVSRYSMMVRSMDGNDIPIFPKEWILQGSNDGITFVNIDSRTNITPTSKGEVLTFDIPTVTYKIFRINVIANNGYSGSGYYVTGIADIDLFTFENNNFIKYEPTYFIGTINGYEQVDDLLDNPIELGLNGNNAFNSIHQPANIKDMQPYDKIEIVTEINTGGPWMYYNKMSISKEDIIFNTTGNYSTGTMLLSSNFGSVYAASVSFNFVNNTQVYIIDTLCNTANWTKIRIKAIRGIKSIYKIDNKTA